MAEQAGNHLTLTMQGADGRLSVMEKLLENIPLFSAVIAFAIAQVLKPLIRMLLGNGWEWRYLTTTGGMPSSHSSASAALTVSVGMIEGIDSTAFAICLIIAIVIMNDAMNVRYETGKQAELLNEWSEFLSEIHKNGPFSPIAMKTMVGHSATQVFAGALLGIITGAVFTYVRTHG